MEASVAAAPPEPVVMHDGSAEATRSTAELFQWSGHVHVGRGAEECPYGTTGKCQVATHFHAWVCLPNAYQIRDITDKARAARARKLRALRDTESDSFATLECELEEIERSGMDQLYQVIAQRQVDDALFDIIAEVQKDDEFEHQQQDAEEFQRLTALPPDERPAEEYERLQAQMLRYADVMQGIIDGRIRSAVDSMRLAPNQAAIDAEREWRLKNISDEFYLYTYYTWTIYTCARKPVENGFPTERVFQSPQEQHDAPPEVIDALREKVRELEQATTRERRGDAAGNS